MSYDKIDSVDEVEVKVFMEDEIYFAEEGMEAVFESPQVSTLWEGFIESFRKIFGLTQSNLMDLGEFEMDQTEDSITVCQQIEEWDLDILKS